LEREVRVPRVPVLRARSIDALPALLSDAGFTTQRPVVVVVGGASGMAPEAANAFARALREAVVPVVLALGAALGAAVVDGGTDSGVMRATGRARRESGAVFDLIGVAAEGTVSRRSGGTEVDEHATDLETHHDLAVLVPGEEWGAETKWLQAVASVLAEKDHSVTVLVNGGEIAYRDVAASHAVNRPVLVLGGTGRTADAVAAAASGKFADPRAEEIARSPLTTVLPITAAAEVREELERLLG
jgi:hypothetical protein